MKTKEFYDKIWGSQNTIDEDKDILSMRSDSIVYSYELAGALHGKKLLEIGCGAGFQTIEFAKRGAFVTAVDFSESSVKNARLLLSKHKLKAEVLTMNAEALSFPEELFDIVYINSVLMHSNKKKVLIECARVLKKSGKAIIVEPLKYNPFIMPYRLLFSAYRKTNPRYMSLSLFKKYSKYFSEMKHKEFYFFYVLTLPVQNIIDKAGWINRIVIKIDGICLKYIPPIRDLCWISVVEYRK